MKKAIKIKDLKRCSWTNDDLLMILYHDNEWGLPLYDDRKLFELLILEGAQAGLSWKTILKKRENYRQAFDQFNPQKIARYSQKKVEQLLINTGIVRNRLKIQSVIVNAQAYLKVQEEWNSFAAYIWHFVEGKPIQNRWKDLREIPNRTAVSDRMSKDLKKRGFKFVGSTICYAFMQAAGLVNDHIRGCFCYKKIKA